MNRRRMIAPLALGILLTSWAWRAPNAGGLPTDDPLGARQEAGDSSGPVETPEFENDQVRVVRMHLGPHEKIPMHLLPAHLVIWLTQAHLKMTMPDGKTSQARFKAGQAIWVAAQKHAGENLTDRPIEFVAVFLKERGQPANSTGR